MNIVGQRAMDAESICKVLQKLSFDNSDINVSTLQCYINDALGYLVDAKFRKTALQILSRCMQYFPMQSQLLLVRAVEDLTKSHVNDRSLKSILVLCDAPTQIKRVILEDPQLLCCYLLKILQESTPLCLQDSQLNCDLQYSILEEDIFVTIKIVVHILQNTGTKLLEAALDDNPHSKWESSWIQSLLSILVSIVRSKILQKETHSMTGVALAHVVNAISSARLSQRLAIYLLQITGSKGSVQHSAELKLGPLVIGELYTGGEEAKLSQLVIVNGLLTVCSPELLLGHMKTFGGGDIAGQSILRYSFDVLRNSCSATVDPQTKFYSFQVLSAWMDAMSRITMERYHRCKETETVFQSNSLVCTRLLDLIWENREDMIEGVPKLVLSIFNKLLDLHNAEKAAYVKDFSSDELIESITKKILEDPWYIRGKYTLLCELFRHVTTSQILAIDSSFPSTLCKSYGTSTLVSAVNECYRSFIAPKKRVRNKRTEEWNAETWNLIFTEEFLAMLANNKTKTKDNCVLYFIPTTLQQIPEVFKNMKSVILSKLTEKYSYDDEGVDEWHMRRRNFCYGYCAVFKIGRKLGLASITDVDLDLLQECLRHNDDDLRAEAVAVLCYNNKTTEPISQDEQSLILDFLHLNLNCASSSFRQTLFVSMKNLMARLRDSCIMLLRDFNKLQKRKQKAGTSQIAVPDNLTTSIGLQLLYTVLETFSSPKDAVKRGRTAESLKNLTDWVESIGKWKFICYRNLVTLISCLQDQHDEIRELALNISKWFPFNATDMNPTDVAEFRENLMTQAITLLHSPRIRDAESGAVLLEFFCLRYLSWESCSIFDVQSWDKQDCKALTNSLSFDGIVHMMFCLLQNAETQIQESYNDFLNAAFKQPVFGSILASCRCFSNFIQYLSSDGKPLEGRERCLGIFRRLVESSIRVCSKATEMALSVFSNHGKALGGSPSFAEMKVALENTVIQSKSFRSLKESIGFQHCLELVSSFCWLNIKAATLFLGEIGTVLTLDCLRISERNEIFPDQALSDIGKIFRETLINCRHKGVIENSFAGFQKLCKGASTISSKTRLLDDWVKETINAVVRNDLNSSVTKRSAGLPMFIQPVMSACRKNPQFSFQTYIETLIFVAKRPYSPSVKEESDLPQVQAMNILKAIYRDSSTGTDVLRFAEDGLILSIDGFTSKSWSIRNAAQLLLGALIPRMLGQRITQADKSHHNSVTASRFFKMYPKLSDFFVKILERGVTYEENLTYMPGVIPVLTILSKLRPCEDKDVQSTFYPLLQDLMSCPVYAVRKLASLSMALFIPIDSVKPFLEKWTTPLGQTDHNFNHGLLLMVKQLLEIKLDDRKFARTITMDAFLQISSTVLQANRQPYMCCTLLDIFRNLIPVVYKSNTRENLIYRGIIRDGVMKMVDKVNRREFSRNGIVLGGTLVPKHIAQASLCCVTEEQSIDIDFADNLMSGLLTSPSALLVSETAAAVTQYIEEGKTLRQELRRKVFEITCSRVKILSDQAGNLDLIECCSSVCSVHDFDIPSHRLFELLQDMRMLGYENVSHRTLAVILPYSGLIFSYCLRKNLDLSSCCEDVFRLVETWSKKIYACSFASEREILRLGSLKAIQISASSFFQYYDSTLEDDSSFRQDIVADSCSRFIMALCNFIQDEDQTIRNTACDAVANVNNYNCNNVTYKIHPNWAMTLVFELIANKMMRNQTLVTSLYQHLKELLECQFDLVAESREALLFEQESANLFSEDVVFAEQIMQCLQEIKKEGYFHLNIIPTDDRIAGLSRELITKCNRTIRQFGDTTPGTANSVSFGYQMVVMIVSLSLEFLQLSDNARDDTDIEAIVDFLQKAKLGKDLHPFLEEEINRTFADS